MVGMPGRTGDRHPTPITAGTPTWRPHPLAPPISCTIPSLITSSRFPQPPRTPIPHALADLSSFFPPSPSSSLQTFPPPVPLPAMDAFLGSKGFGPLLFLILNLAVAFPLSAFASAWRRRSPPPLDESDPNADCGATPDTGPEGPSCAVCLEHIGHDGRQMASSTVASHPRYPLEAGYRDGAGHVYAFHAAASSRGVALSCGHVFHSGCIFRWATLSPSVPSCPMCKTPIGVLLCEVKVL